MSDKNCTQELLERVADLEVRLRKFQKSLLVFQVESFISREELLRCKDYLIDDKDKELNHSLFESIQSHITTTTTKNTFGETVISKELIIFKK